MRTNITYKLVQSFSPCYELSTIGVSSDYSATIPDFIREYRHKVKHKKDILWVLLRDIFLTNQELRLFAVWCARQVQHLMIDNRSIETVDTSERYANGLATEEELGDARNAAYDAYTAGSAAYDDAAYDAAYAAYAYVAYAAVYAARAAAAYDAATAAAAAACTAARDATDAAVYDSGETIAYDAQIDKLLEIFEKKDAA